MRILLAAVALILAASPAVAQRGWEVIGYKAVGAGTDRDSVRVRGAQRHRQIRICSLNRPVDMREVSVRFANGARQYVPVRRVIAPGTCTRAVDLRGRRRDMTRVDMVYGRILRGARTPIVRVQAR